MCCHIGAVKRCCERTRTARRRALCGRRRLRHAAAILLRQAGGIAPALNNGEGARTSPTAADRFGEQPRISHPFRLSSRNCRTFRFDCFLISNSTFLSTITRSIDAPFQALLPALPDPLAPLARPRIALRFLLLSPLSAMQYAAAFYALLIIAIGIVPDRV